MPDRLYGTPNAGINNYTLFEELSELAINGGGYVFLRKTCARIDRRDERSYPPVYTVIYRPGFWQNHGREFLNILWDIADRHEAKMVIRNEDGKFGFYFEHS